MQSPSNRVLYVVALNHATNDGSVYLLSSLFPIVLSLFELSVLQVGIIVALGYLVNVLFQPVVGHYGEGRDPSRMLAFGISLIAVSIFSFVFATGFLSLLVAVIVLRLGSSFFHPIGISTVSNAYRGPGLQRAMGFQSAFGNFGVLLTFVTAVPLYLIAGWRWTFLAFATWALADIMITVIVLRGSQSRSRESNSRGAMPAPGSARIPVFFLLAAFISGGTYAVVLNFANIFLGLTTRLDPTQVNWIVSAFIAFAFLGALSTGVWGKVLPTGIRLACSYLVASGAIAGFTLFAGNVLLDAVLLIATGFFISSTYPLTYTELSRFLAAENRSAGASFGALSSGQTVGASVLGLVSGSVSQFFGLGLSFGTIGVLMLLGSVLTLFWLRQNRTKTL